MNTEQKRVIEKIQKLFALATSANEHEARLAAERANEMLLRHNLSMQQVQAQAENLDGYTSHTAYDAARRKPEQKYILPLLRLHFGITIVRLRDKKNGPVKFVFVGTEVNVQVATYVHDFLMIKLPELWAAYKATATQLSGASRASYYSGVASGIHAQMTAKRKAVQKETGLVLTADPNVDKYLEKIMPNTVTAKRGKPWRADDPHAANAGVEHGKKLSIHRGISAQRTDGPQLALAQAKK